MITATQVKKIVVDAGFLGQNPYADTYIHALRMAEDGYGEKGVKTQILYILNNLRAKTPEQKAAKKQLQQLAK